MSNVWFVVVSVAAFACLAILARAAGMAALLNDFVGSDEDHELPDPSRRAPEWCRIDSTSKGASHEAGAGS